MQVSFNPLDNTQVCVIGNHIFKLFRYIDGNLKHFGFQKMEPQHLLSHAWVSLSKYFAQKSNNCLTVS